MFTFIGALVTLIAGYFIYGRVVDSIFGADEKRQTPAELMADGVDFVPMPWYKIFLIQFLNIAGLGPIFAGATHDYLSGMISIRHNGASISEIIGEYLGNNARQIMRVFSLILLILVGTVFMTGPAKLLANLSSISVNVWLVIIVIYH
ncbi:MAG: carbon starvation protein A [Halanaerobiales bacterium]|nr:carbon starvation protein A [Halanaerobiales bacterium]